MQLSFNIHLADQNPPLPEFAELIRKKENSIRMSLERRYLSPVGKF